MSSKYSMGVLLSILLVTVVVAQLASVGLVSAPPQISGPKKIKDSAPPQISGPYEIEDPELGPKAKPVAGSVAEPVAGSRIAEPRQINEPELGPEQVPVQVDEGVPSPPSSLGGGIVIDIKYPTDETADTYVFQARPTNNFGSWTTIYVGRYTYSGVSGAERGLLKFSLTRIPAGSTIIDAQLGLYCWAISGSGENVKVQVTDDSWTESGVTWANAPAPGEEIVPPKPITSDPDNYVWWTSQNLTNFVAQEFAGDKTVSFYLIGTGENTPPDHGVNLDGKEYSGGSVAPILRVRYIPPVEVNVEVSPDTIRDYPGTTRSFDVKITNPSETNAHNYILENSDNQGWPLNLSKENVLLGPGESATVELEVSVPLGVDLPTIDEITIKATAEDDNTITDSDTCQMIASRWISETDVSYVNPEGLRDYAISVVGAGEYIFIANSATSTGTNRFYRYNTSSKWWENVASPVDDFRNGTAMAWDGGDYIYVLLGSAYAAERYYFYRYSITAGTWEQLENSPGRQGAGDAIAYCTWDNNVYAVMGKADQNGRFGLFGRYNTSTRHWETLSLPTGLDAVDDGACLTAVGQYLYLAPGEIYDDGPDTFDFWRYDVQNRQWNKLANFPKGYGDGTSMEYAGDGDSIFAIGGSNYLEEYRCEAYVYSIREDRWTQIEDVPVAIGNLNGDRLAVANGNLFHVTAMQDVPFGDSIWRYPLYNYFVAVEIYPSDDDVAGVRVDPGYNQAKGGYRLETMTVRVRNMGMLADNYTVSATDELNWWLKLQRTQLRDVPPGLYIKQDLDIEVPILDVPPNARNLVTVRAVGQATNSASVTTRKITADLWPVADSYVRSDYPNNNYGTLSYMYVGRYYNAPERAYIKFSLEGIPSNVEDIAVGELWLWAWGSYKLTNVQLWSVTDDSWTETGINWNNAPPGRELLDTITVPNYSEDAWLHFDSPSVTEFIDNQYHGDKVVSFMLKSEELEDTSVSLSSRETLDERDVPKLVICYKKPISVDIAPDRSSGAPGSTIDHTVQVWNNTGQSKTVTLSITQNTLGWNITLDDSQLVIGAGESAKTRMHVEIPDDAAMFADDNILLTATSDTLSDSEGIHVFSTGIKPTDDVYVYQGYPDSNYNGDTYLRVTSFSIEDPIPLNRRSLLRFNVPSGNVVSAKLWLWCFSVSHPISTLQAWKVSGGWDEDTATWNSQPTWGDLLGTTSVTTEKQWVTINLNTSYIQPGGELNIGLKVEPESSTGDAMFDSKEYYKAEYHPFLEVTYAPPTWYRTWTAQSGTGSEDAAFRLAVDGDYIYTAGLTKSQGSTIDFLVLKYDKSGNLQWSRTWDNGSNDTGRGVAVGSDGVYVVGSSWRPENKKYVGVLLKYNKSDGSLLWQRGWSWGPENWATTTFTDVAVGSDGNVYISGLACTTGTGLDAILVKFDSSGNLKNAIVWNNSGDDRAFISVADDAIYLGGWTSSATQNMQAFVVKYNYSLVKQWEAVWGGSKWDTAMDLAVTGEGIYVAGVMDSPSSGYDGFLTKLNPANGSVLWTRYLDNSSAHDGLCGVEAYGGYVYVTGFTGLSSSSKPDLILLKYDSSGNKLWQKNWGDASTEDKGGDVKVSDGIYVAGCTSAPGTNVWDALLVKYLIE